MTYTSIQVAMVAWRVTLLTPQFPEGRDIIVIANDITNQIGSFGPEEDRLFQQASVLSREQGLPRLYIAANSGARIGLAEELKQLFKVAWVDDQQPDKGFKYLYLSPADYMKVRYPYTPSYCPLHFHTARHTAPHTVTLPLTLSHCPLHCHTAPYTVILPLTLSHCPSHRHTAPHTVTLPLTPSHCPSYCHR